MKPNTKDLTIKMFNASLGKQWLTLLSLLALAATMLAACGEISPTAAPVSTAIPATSVPTATPSQPQPTATTTAAPTSTPGTMPRSSAAQDAQQAETVINRYFAALNTGDYQTAYDLLSARYREELKSAADFAKTYNDTLKAVSVNDLSQENVTGSGENWLVYRVNLQIQAGPTPSNFNNGPNLEWVKLVKSGQDWQLDQFATSPF